MMEVKRMADKDFQKLYSWNKKGIFNFDYVLQRDGSQWTANQKNALIDTIVNGYILPEIWIIEDIEHTIETIKVKTVVDGKQRLTTVFSFMDDEWKLAKTFEPVYFEGKYYDVAGKKFSELDPEIQMLIKEYSVSFKLLIGYDEEQLEEQFMKLNNGSPFKSTQKFRVALGTQIAPKFDEKMLNLPFWDRCTPSVANSKTDAKLGIALECLMLLTDYECKGYGSAEIQRFAQYFRENYNEAAVDELAMLLEKLDEYYPTDDECVALLKKLHIPALVLCMKEFLRIQNGEIKFNNLVKFNFTEEDFEKWLYEWSTKMYRGEYTDKGCKEGTTKKDKVEQRITIICDRLIGAAELKMMDYIKSVKGGSFDWEHGDYSEFMSETEPKETVNAEIVEEPTPMSVEDILGGMEIDEEIVESEDKWEGDVNVQTTERGTIYDADAS